MAFAHLTFGSAPFGVGSQVIQEAIPDPVPTVTSIIVTPEGAIVAGGATLQFYKQVFGENNPPQTGTWATTLGTIDLNGLVTAPPTGLADQVGTVTFTSDFNPDVKGSVTFAVPGIVVVPDPDEPPVEPGRRFARPVADLANSGWRPSVGSELFPMLTQLDSEFIEATGPASCDIALGPVKQPDASTDRAIRYQAYSPSGDGLTMELRQGDALIARWVHETLPTVPTIFEQFLTAEQRDSITDYADLRARPVAFEAA